MAVANDSVKGAPRQTDLSSAADRLGLICERLEGAVSTLQLMVKATTDSNSRVCSTLSAQTGLLEYLWHDLEDLGSDMAFTASKVGAP